MKDPYRVLGVGRNATQADIKSAYRSLVRECHPDRAPGDRATEDRFKEVVAAYEQLSGKSRIDEPQPRQSNERERGRGGWTGSSPFNAFYRRKRSESASNIRIDGADVTYGLSVDFLEAAQGVTKRVSMTNGKRLEVRVPPGTTDGQVLRLRGQGMGGLNGGKAGDALIEIKVKANADFTVQGRDVHVDVPVSLPEAVLGCKIEVDTIDGPVSVTIPEGSNTGTTLRLKGRGLQPQPSNGSAAQRGDQYVRLKVVLPAKPDSELISFVRKWGARRPYPVRNQKSEKSET